MYEYNKSLQESRQSCGVDMFAPIPFTSVRTDDDCAAVQWKRGRKNVVMNLDCYGGSRVSVGLSDPPGGVVNMPSLESAWLWFCSPLEELPEGK